MVSTPEEATNRVRQFAKDCRGVLVIKAYSPRGPKSLMMSDLDLVLGYLDSVLDELAAANERLDELEEDHG